MVSFILPNLRQYVLDAIDVIYGDASGAKEMMASDLGVSTDTVRHWIKGRRSPSRAALLKLQELHDVKLARSAGFKRRLKEGLPSMVCPICGGEFIVHHHQSGRMVQCREYPANHVFEPEPGLPVGLDVPKRFIQVPGGLATIEARASSPRPPIVVGRNPNNIIIELSREVTPSDVAAFRSSLNALADHLGVPRGIVGASHTRIQGSLPQNLDGLQSRALRDWFDAECDRINKEG